MTNQFLKDTCWFSAPFSIWMSICLLQCSLMETHNLLFIFQDFFKLLDSWMETVHVAEAVILLMTGMYFMPKIKEQYLCGINLGYEKRQKQRFQSFKTSMGFCHT